MKITDRVSHKLISEEHKSTKKWKTLAGIMAIIVTFTTTYSLIMPAITVSREQVDEIAGLYLDDPEEAFDIVEDTGDEEELCLPEAAAAVSLSAGCLALSSHRNVLLNRSHIPGNTRNASRPGSGGSAWRPTPAEDLPYV